MWDRPESQSQSLGARVRARRPKPGARGQSQVLGARVGGLSLDPGSRSEAGEQNWCPGARVGDRVRARSHSQDPGARIRAQEPESGHAGQSQGLGARIKARRPEFGTGGGGSHGGKNSPVCECIGHWPRRAAARSSEINGNETKIAWGT